MYSTALSVSSTSTLWTRHLTGIALVCLLVLSAAPLMGQEGQEIEEDAEGNLYIPLAEPLVVNYGGAGRLKYLRADIALRVEDTAEASIIRHHMPLIRHKMVMLFSRQDEQAVNTQQGREQLRLAAKEEVNAALAQEEGDDALVEDLLFNNFSHRSFAHPRLLSRPGH